MAYSPPRPVSYHKRKTPPPRAAPLPPCLSAQKKDTWRASSTPGYRKAPFAAPPRLCTPTAASVAAAVAAADASTVVAAAAPLPSPTLPLPLPLPLL